MISHHIDDKHQLRNMGMRAASAPTEILNSLVQLASAAAHSQVEAFALRLIDALMAISEHSIDSREANLCFTSAGLLRKNTYAYTLLASAAITKALQDDMQRVIQQLRAPSAHAAADAAAAKQSIELELVSYEDMDNKVRLGHIARPVIAKHTDALDALNLRFARLLGRDEFQLSQNPLRPEVFMTALNAAWAEFDPEADSHALFLPLLKIDVFLDMAPILTVVNDALIGHGILPALGDSYRIRKSTNYAAEQKREAHIAEGLRRMLSGEAGVVGAVASMGGFSGISGMDNLGAAMGGRSGAAGGMGDGGVGGYGGDGGGIGGSASAGGTGGFGDGSGYAGGTGFASMGGECVSGAVSHQLMGFLAGMQKTMLTQQLAGLVNHSSASSAVLSNIKRQAPTGTLSQIDENTIDLLTKVFDLVFHDKNIAGEMKSLIGFLQVPVLKAALLDKDFFFQQEHPARRLVETLAQSSMEWDAESGENAPLYQTMKRVVEKVQQDFDQKMSVFSEVLTDLQTFIEKEEKVATEALESPINDALQIEKQEQVIKTAKNEVAMRVGTGEVVAFVETFLEDKWVSVLTVAYTLQEEKPTAVQSAVGTMDDLIWSVKPKITAAQRKEFLTKLPSILSRLNKWLTVVEWEEDDRARFFLELAETHASIVRSPLALTPERQLELAVEVAQQAAERRLEKQASAAPEPQVDDFDDQVKKLDRGIWLNFSDEHGGAMKAKLSWVSPMKSLFIFTTHRKEQTFQLTDVVLAQRLRDNTAQTVSLDRLVDRALDQVFANGANDPDLEMQSVA